MTVNSIGELSDTHFFFSYFSGYISDRSMFSPIFVRALRGAEIHFETLDYIYLLLKTSFVCQLG